MGALSTRAERRAEIEEVVYASALCLDERRFGAFLALTTPEFRYRIEAYSPELRKDMLWLDHDRQGLAGLVELLPRHHVNGASWLRHVVLYGVTEDGPDRVRAVSSLAAFHTEVDVGDAHVDGGRSRLFLVGRYHDRLERAGDRWLISERVVRVETRELGIGSHLFP